MDEDFKKCLCICKLRDILIANGKQFLLFKIVISLKNLQDYWFAERFLIRGSRGESCTKREVVGWKFTKILDLHFCSMLITTSWVSCPVKGYLAW